MKKSILLSALVVLIGLAACQKKDDGVQAAGPGVAGGLNGQVGLLPNGTVPPSQTTTIGYFAQTSSFDSYYKADAGRSAYQLGGAYQDFLKTAMGVCDRQTHSGGQAGCNAWVGGFNDLVLQFDSVNSNEARLIFRSYPMMNAGYNYSYSRPSMSDFFKNLVGFPSYSGYAGAMYNPLVLKMKAGPSNNSQGFTVQNLGATFTQSYDKMVKLEVPSGKLLDDAFVFHVYYDNQEIGNGRLARCRTANCGL